MKVHAVQELERFEGADGRVGQVVTKSGLEVECDFVVIGAGVHPELHLAEQAGLETGSGVLTDRVPRDERRRASSPPATSPSTTASSTAAGCGSSTGTSRSTRASTRRSTCSARSRHTTSCPTSGPTSPTGPAWSTSARQRLGRGLVARRAWTRASSRPGTSRTRGRGGADGRPLGRPRGARPAAEREDRRSERAMRDARSRIRRRRTSPSSTERALGRLVRRRARTRRSSPPAAADSADSAGSVRERSHSEKTRAARVGTRRWCRHVSTQAGARARHAAGVCQRSRCPRPGIGKHGAAPKNLGRSIPVQPHRARTPCGSRSCR